MTINTTINRRRNTNAFCITDNTARDIASIIRWVDDHDVGLRLISVSQLPKKDGDDHYLIRAFWNDGRYTLADILLKVEATGSIKEVDRVVITYGRRGHVPVARHP